MSPLAPFTLAQISDTHQDFARFEPGVVQADAIALLGDVCEAHNGSPVRWAQRMFPDQPVFYIPGNHEFYGDRMNKVLERLQREARGSNVHLLYNDTLEFKGVRILGTPLWSDLASNGPVCQAELTRTVIHQISDFSCIYKTEGKNWSVADMLRENKKAKAFLNKELAKDTAVQKIVLTHWGPHLGSIHPQFQGDKINPYFINHYPDLVMQAMLWLHGHTHQPCDYQVGPKGHGRVICHPRGYPKEEAKAPRAYQPLILKVDPNTGSVVRKRWTQEAA